MESDFILLHLIQIQSIVFAVGTVLSERLLCSVATGPKSSVDFYNRFR